MPTAQSCQQTSEWDVLIRVRNLNRDVNFEEFAETITDIEDIQTLIALYKKYNKIR